MSNLTIEEGLVIKLTPNQLANSPLKDSARGFTILTMPAAFRRTVDKPLDILAGHDHEGMSRFWGSIFNRNRNDLVYYAVDVRTRKYEFILQVPSSGRRYFSTARVRMQYEVHDPSKVALDKEDALRGLVDTIENKVAGIVSEQTRTNVWLLSSMDMILASKLEEMVTLYSDWGIVVKDMTLLEWILSESYATDYNAHVERLEAEKQRQEELRRLKEEQERERSKHEEEQRHAVEMKRIENDTAKQLRELNELRIRWDRENDLQREQTEAEYKLKMEDVRIQLLELQKRDSTREHDLKALLAEDEAWLDDRLDELRTQNLLQANTRRDEVETAEAERRRRREADEEYHISAINRIRIERVRDQLALMGITVESHPLIGPMLMANPDKTYEVFNLLFTQGLERAKHLLDEFVSTNKELIIRGDQGTEDYNNMLQKLMLLDMTPQNAGLLGGSTSSEPPDTSSTHPPVDYDPSENSDYDNGPHSIFECANSAVVDDLTVEEDLENIYPPEIKNIAQTLISSVTTEDMKNHLSAERLPNEESISGMSDEVAFSAYYPRSVKANIRYGFIVYAHLIEKEHDIEIDVQKFKDELGGFISMPSKAKVTVSIKRGTPITIVPECDELTFDPPSFTRKWDSPWKRFEFDFKLSDKQPDGVFFVRISILIGGIEIAHIKCAFEHVSEAQTVHGEILSNPLAAANMKCQTATPYQRIFISYSRQDSRIAKSYKFAQIALGNDAFLDVDNLRAGEDWRAALARAIDEADIFQLFWSENSAKSEYCRHEWDYALKTRCPNADCEGFIRPVYWRNPMPSPPPELSRINFRFVPFEDQDD